MELLERGWWIGFIWYVSYVIQKSPGKRSIPPMKARRKRKVDLGRRNSSPTMPPACPRLELAGRDCWETATGGSWRPGNGPIGQWSQWTCHYGNAEKYSQQALTGTASSVWAKEAHDARRDLLRGDQMQKSCVSLSCTPLIDAAWQNSLLDEIDAEGFSGLCGALVNWKYLKHSILSWDIKGCRQSENLRKSPCHFRDSSRIAGTTSSTCPWTWGTKQM